MADAGYSGTPLAKKLGFKPGQAVAFLDLPEDLQPLARAEAFSRADRALAPPEGGYDLVHAFFAAAAPMREALPRLKAAIRPAGMIWISWPKKASKAPTDVVEDVVRAAALAAGLVDVKVCAVNAVWSGLKLVIPVADRPPAR